KYLTWLEIDLQEQEKKTGRPAVAAPVAIPVAGAAPVAPVAGVPSGAAGAMAASTGKMPALPLDKAKARSAVSKAERARAKAAAPRRKARKARKSHGQLQLPAAQVNQPIPVAPPVAPAIDVELVALPPVSGTPRRAGPLTRRDFVMFSLGVGTV